MHPLVDKWIAALESDEYTQGTQYLRSKYNKFCCLGVLCDLAVKDGLLEEPTLNLDRYIYGSDAAYNMVPESLAKELNMSVSGYYGDNYHTDNMCLWRDNDLNHKSFKEIAQIIRYNSDKLFSHANN